jgi:hypothetical protein
MFLIDKHGERPICASCHTLGPYVKAVSDVFVCAACVRATEAQVEKFAESVPELRDHRLKRWRIGCDCARCLQGSNRAV